jgi:hypothetical protein
MDEFTASTYIKIIPLTIYLIPRVASGPWRSSGSLRETRETLLTPDPRQRSQASREDGPHLPGTQKNNTVEEKDRRAVRDQTWRGKSLDTVPPTNSGLTARARTCVRPRP